MPPANTVASAPAPEPSHRSTPEEGNASGDLAPAPASTAGPASAQDLTTATLLPGAAAAPAPVVARSDGGQTKSGHDEPSKAKADAVFDNLAPPPESSPALPLAPLVSGEEPAKSVLSNTAAGNDQKKNESGSSAASSPPEQHKRPDGEPKPAGEQPPPDLAPSNPAQGDSGRDSPLVLPEPHSLKPGAGNPEHERSELTPSDTSKSRTAVPESSAPVSSGTTAGGGDAGCGGADAFACVPARSCRFEGLGDRLRLALRPIINQGLRQRRRGNRAVPNGRTAGGPLRYGPGGRAIPAIPPWNRAAARNRRRANPIWLRRRLRASPLPPRLAGAVLRNRPPRPRPSGAALRRRHLRPRRLGGVRPSRPIRMTPGAGLPTRSAPPTEGLPERIPTALNGFRSPTRARFLSTAARSLTLWQAATTPARPGRRSATRAHAAKNALFEAAVPEPESRTPGSGPSSRPLAGSDPSPRAAAAARPGGSAETRRVRAPRRRANENFWTISRLYYSSGRYYRALWKSNEAKYPDINVLHVGDVIMVPAIEDLDPAMILPARSPAPASTIARTNRASGTSDSVPLRRVGQSDPDLDLPAGEKHAPRRPRRSRDLAQFGP